ncbi:hypothetical protein P170DRAFT_287522 [Aspergillus steynii IBT 23096]|uniref:Retrovirus-related Pol polyprotein from transposon TNT 1-94-like beta-barrel domain-containing protein n=1 Tax=Aspergillus steynii IBT 23096 TaxID=1392250 RepID=A0A2I2FV99_9EURO|nr:uncharacterized protein P170DRAFT_287522 [Aspergillus steynii IBT 23096]PLB44496.1 hypothetical protein P170DRAFT_287522 [Aspergillus steynii IBT 23096]
MTESHPCWDWMIVLTSTHHYARDRLFFKDYVPVGIRSPASPFGEEDLDIAGMGTVELLVHTGPESTSTTRTLVLKNVLHIPNALCNGFNGLQYSQVNGGGGLTFGSLTRQGTDRDGSPLWYAKPFHGFSRLVIAGNPEGKSYLEDGLISLSIFVDETRLPQIVRPRARDRAEETSSNFRCTKGTVFPHMYLEF